MGILDRKARNKHIRQAWGIVFAISGINFMGVIKVIIGSKSNYLSILISIISLLLITDYSRVIRGKILAINTEIGVSFFYSIICLIANLYGGTIDAMSHYGIVYQLFYFIQIILVWNIDSFDDGIFVRVFYWAQAIMNILALYIILCNYLNTGILFFNNLGDETITRATIGSMAFTLICVLLVYTPKIKGGRAINALLWGVAFANIATSGRRTIELTIIIIVVLSMNNRFKAKFSKKKLFHFMMLAVGIIVGVICLYNMVPIIRNLVLHAVEFFENGVITYLGGRRIDMSAQIRRQNLKRLWDDYINNSSIQDIVWGRGYMKGWIDFPILQAFYDMGIIVGGLFVISHIVFSIKYILIKSKFKSTEIFRYYVCLMVVEFFTSGTPYGRLLGLTLLITNIRNIEIGVVNDSIC